MLKYVSEYDLSVFRPSGTMDMALIREYYSAVSGYKQQGCTRRFVDLDRLSKIDFGFDDIPQIEASAQSWRNRSSKDIRVALLATKSVSLGVANMVARVMDRPDYRIEVVSSPTAAANFLLIPAEEFETVIAD